MIRTIAALSLLALAACGADGEPVQPTMNAGISLGTSGVGTHVGLGLRKGPLTLGYRVK
ncbi:MULTISPECIES: hypothetical protein [Roseobacteraceae]|jgi:hypothetical protein|uniref:Argininosuccinate lyase n=1 Tax=Pseudosulfitobacter pseudonitzschiae TaxID=1402135 RepID=A0A221JWV2_9RHOB|nr:MULTISPECIES: hypothetical protein [Roseobacteraceae]ASM71204.1 hypothetical protein SULPSESMR1_00369 [Pseudosulfitobacter pseudonitzschiae]